MPATQKTAADRIQDKWDALAAPQLRAELERLEQELSEAHRRIQYLEDVADSWRDDALRAITLAGAQPGLTIDGALVPVGGAQ